MTRSKMDLGRALVLAPFFSLDTPSRPYTVAAALAELMPVDVVTADFAHGRKTRRQPLQSRRFARILYLRTPPYNSNVGLARLFSHVVFSWRASLYFLRNRCRYDTVYATAPLNLLAWVAFSCAGAHTRILDVVDIWPDALPFPLVLRRALSPFFMLWKRLFASAARKADIVMSASHGFLNEAKRFAGPGAHTAHFYLCHNRLESPVPRQPVFTLAYVGNLGHLYDFETLLDVLSAPDLRQTAQLFVIGAGDRKEWLLRELARRQIRHRFFGTVQESARLASILCSCHAGFNGYVPTTATFSYKAATYLAAGLPLINSMSGDLHDLVGAHDLGENYASGDCRQLREALLRLSRRNPAEISNHCRDFFDRQLETSRVQQAIRDFLAQTLVLSAVAVESEKELARA